MVQLRPRKPSASRTEPAPLVGRRGQALKQVLKHNTTQRRRPDYTHGSEQARGGAVLYSAHKPSTEVSLASAEAQALHSAELLMVKVPELPVPVADARARHEAVTHRAMMEAVILLQ